MNYKQFPEATFSENSRRNSKETRGGMLRISGRILREFQENSKGNSSELQEELCENAGRYAERIAREILEEFQEEFWDNSRNNLERIPVGILGEFREAIRKKSRIISEKTLGGTMFTLMHILVIFDEIAMKIQLTFYEFTGNSGKNSARILWEIPQEVLKVF